jgi:hypothetical protein
MSRNFRVFIALTLMSSTFAPLHDAAAQGWWSKATDAIKSEAGQKTIETLSGTAGTALSSDKISAGIKEALRIGTEKVTQQLSAKGGFSLDKNIHIPLPETLSMVDAALSRLGMNGLTSDLESRLNVAAEQAAPKAKALFVDAISKMTIDDAKNILSGPNNAATDYLRKTMGAGLETELSPVVESTLAQSGAVKAYDQVIGKYSKIPFSQSVKTDLNKYVVTKAIDGIFYYVAQEEAAIRADTTKRTTELLKQVFSAQ